MIFIETPVFTRQIKRLISDDEYRDLQWGLVLNPKAGALISGGGGLRKIRHTSAQRHKGKRGGVRVIYYIQSPGRFYMIFAYGKDSQSDLTSDQLKTLRSYVQGGLL